MSSRVKVAELASVLIPVHFLSLIAAQNAIRLATAMRASAQSA